MDEQLRALADPTRRQILSMVWSAERSAGEIATAFGKISRPAVSQHLKVLLDADLVRVRPIGTRRLYRTHRPAISAVRDMIDAFWTDALSALKLAAEEEELSAARGGDGDG